MPETTPRPAVDVNDETAFRTYILTQLGRLEGAMAAGFEAVREGYKTQYAVCVAARARLEERLNIANNGFGAVRAEMDAMERMRARLVRLGVVALKYVAPPIIVAFLTVMGFRTIEGTPTISKAQIQQIAAQVETALKESKP